MHTGLAGGLRRAGVGESGPGEDEEPAELFSQEEGREEEVKKERSETKTNTGQDKTPVHQGSRRRSACRTQSQQQQRVGQASRGAGQGRGSQRKLVSRVRVQAAKLHYTTWQVVGCD